MLRGELTPFVRYMDDIAIFCHSHHEARELLDRVENLLYEDGLSLGAGKTFIVRCESVLGRYTPAEGVEEFLAGLMDSGDYAPGEEELDEIRLDEVKSMFDGAVAALQEDDYRRSELVFCLRQLGRERDPHALPELPTVLLRMPGLTADGCRYLEALAVPDHRIEVTEALTQIVQGRFHRVQEWLHILRAIQVVPNRAAESLTGDLESLVEGHDDALVRARALLAWGAQSDPASLNIADGYFASAPRQWLTYALVAIQAKDEGAREVRYGEWAAEQRGLGRLAESIRQQRFAWSKL